MRRRDRILIWDALKGHAEARRFGGGAEGDD